jgi:hypothetical protein
MEQPSLSDVSHVARCGAWLRSLVRGFAKAETGL